LQESPGQSTGISSLWTGDSTRNIGAGETGGAVIGADIAGRVSSWASLREIVARSSLQESSGEVIGDLIGNSSATGAMSISRPSAGHSIGKLSGVCSRLASAISSSEQYSQFLIVI
jgi:hypothetical protein